MNNGEMTGVSELQNAHFAHPNHCHEIAKRVYCNHSSTPALRQGADVSGNKERASYLVAKEADLRHAMEQGALLAPQIVETAEGFMLVFITVWEARKQVLTTFRGSIRYWASLDRLAKFLVELSPHDGGAFTVQLVLNRYSPPARAGTQ